MRKQGKVLLAVFTMLFAFICIYVEPTVFAPNNQSQTVFTNRTLVRGSSGNDVRELQSRLKFLGYYKGNVDGAFGYGTYWAVRNFQYKFGMKVDGVVGANTRSRLVAATKGYNPYGQRQQAAQTRQTTPTRQTTQTRQTTPPRPAAVTQPANTRSASIGGRNVSGNDLKLLSNAVYGEARGEPYIGQVAIAAVIFNRQDNAQFPNTIPGIIFQPGAFTAVADGQIWLTPNEQSRKAVRDALNGWDPSGNALYYFNPVTATSKWIWSRPQIKRIGRHIFCK